MPRKKAAALECAICCLPNSIQRSWGGSPHRPDIGNVKNSELSLNRANSYL